MAQCPAPPPPTRQNKNSASTSKKAPKNSDYTPPAAGHPTRKLEPASDIPQPIVRDPGAKMPYHMHQYQPNTHS